MFAQVYDNGNRYVFLKIMLTTELTRQKWQKMKLLLYLSTVVKQKINNKEVINSHDVEVW